MNRNCDLAITCFPCADEASNPYQNLSAEAPDKPFISIAYPRIPPISPGRFTNGACNVYCESSFSQDDADDCARRAALECFVRSRICPTPCPVIPLYPSTPVICQDGAFYCEMAGGAVLGLSQADADAVAQSLCNHRVHETCRTPIGGSGGVVPPAGCPLETGSPTPVALAVPVETGYRVPVEWNIVEINPSGEWLADPFFAFTEIPFDYPPGRYQLRYISGFSDDLSGCNPPIGAPGSGTPGQAGMFGGVDDEFSEAVFYGASQLIGNIFVFSLNDPPLFTPDAGGSQGTIVARCDTTLDLIQARIRGDAPYQTAAGFYGVFAGTPTERRWRDINEHTNTGGRVRLLWDNDFGPVVIQPGYKFKVQMLQVSGLIPQPRHLAVSGYNAALISQFADPAAANNWNGLTSERITYETANPTNASWIADPNGPFGGVVLSYTSAHPTSANGRGWVLDIYSGFAVMWRGFKGVGSTPVGRYYQDSTTTPVGPACLVLEDNSADRWYPGEAPPA